MENIRGSDLPRVRSQRHWRCRGELMHVVNERPWDMWSHLCWHSLCLRVRWAWSKRYHLWRSLLLLGMDCAHVIFLCPSWLWIGCPSRRGRCPIQHPLSSVSMSTTLSEHLNGFLGCRVKHSSKYSSRRQRCHLGHPWIFKSMWSSLCKTTNVAIFDVAHLSIRNARNPMSTRGTPEWHPRLVVPMVRRPKWS